MATTSRSAGEHVRGGTAIAVAMGVMNVASYGYTVVAARVLGPRSYGAFAAVMGLLLVVVIHAANIQDRGGPALVCRRLRRRFSWLRLIFADGGYRGETATCAVAQERLRLQIVRRELGTCGFAVLPRRWVVERTFA